MISLNKNIFWCKHFVRLLAGLGIKHVCISPGYRSTPLTYAFAENKQIKKYIHVDERCSGFFALGLAKQTKSPTAIVTTSGTAVAELYPAVIEAYLQRIPLIVCSADRPEYLKSTGANQTINQENIFSNHIRYFYDFGLPTIDFEIIKNNSSKLLSIISISVNENRGPVHLNFPFEKPFEPSNITDEINEEIFEQIEEINVTVDRNEKESHTDQLIYDKIRSSGKGIIFCGIASYSRDVVEKIIAFSQLTGYPIFADGLSQLRFGKQRKENIISNYTALLKSEKFLDNFNPEVIIQFGSAPTSQSFLDFYEKSNAYKILINKFGDLKDPSRTVDNIIQTSSLDFCNSAIYNLEKLNNRNHEWKEKIAAIDKQVYRTKVKIIENAPFAAEPRIISETLKGIPPNSNLVFSNSLPVRDMDNFASLNNKHFKVYSSRGASGIDGIVSTAAGIAVESKQPTYLIIGDLAFYHDMNGLLALKNLRIPLKIIMIDNFGGAIFEGLPIEKEMDDFQQYFKTPLYLDFRNFVKGYGGNFVEITDWQTFNQNIKYSHGNTFSVLHFKTNSKKSHQIRNRFWNQAVTKIDEMLNED